MPSPIWLLRGALISVVVACRNLSDGPRGAARSSGGEGPRVLVAGSADAGKSSLCRILANYLARSGHCGTLVDFDLVSGSPLLAHPSWLLSLILRTRRRVYVYSAMRASNM